MVLPCGRYVKFLPRLPGCRASAKPDKFSVDPNPRDEGAAPSRLDDALEPTLIAVVHPAIVLVLLTRSDAEILAPVVERFAGLNVIALHPVALFQS